VKRKFVAAICIVSLLVGCVCIYNRYFAYIAEYNMGNSDYRNDSYNGAIAWYNKALERNLPEEKECSIRINKALAYVGLLGEGYDSPDRIADSVSLLEIARDTLLTDNCATEEGTGHSEKAEQLKEEIERMLEELQKKQGSGGEGEEEQADPEEGDTEEAGAKEQNIRQEIERMQENAYQDRQEEEQFMQEFDMEINFDYEGDIW